MSSREPIDVLLIEDEDTVAAQVTRALSALAGEARVVRVPTLSAGAARLATSPSEVILLDMTLPDGRGLGALAVVQAHAPESAVVTLAAPADETVALKSLRQGAVDYLLKTSVFDTVVVRSVRYAAEQARSERRWRQAEAALRRERHLSSAIVDTTAALVVVLDRTGRVVRFNAAAERVSGLSADRLLGRRFGVLSATPAARSASAAMLQQLLDGEPTAEHETEWRSPRGDPPVIAWAGTALRDEAGDVEYVIATGIDVTERKKAERRLQYDAFHDPLTSLPNRALFLDRLERVVARRRRGATAPFGVLFVDLDRFKVINDSLGHGAGDTLLGEVARRISECLRDQDTVARLGGDEFGVLLDGVDGEDGAAGATHLAQRIQERLRDPFLVRGHEVFTSASIGIALGPGDVVEHDDPEELLRDADIAMYRAKSAGRGRYQIFDRAMHAQVVTQLRLETDLRRALERGELCVYYQPIVELGDGRLVGFEALVRWLHPKRGLLLPAEFIPAAEDTGLIVPLGLWVLRQACLKLRTWRDAHAGSDALAMSVNLSLRQFLQPDLAGRVAEILADTGLDPTALVLELTESVVMENPESALRTLYRLAELGVRLCIDDFGIGYSSLASLSRFPIDTLKIDRSFVRDIHRPRSAAVVHTIAELARNLGMGAVAEGVETPAQLHHLRSLGATLAQGFLFSHPLPAADASALVAGGLPLPLHPDAARAGSDAATAPEPRSRTPNPGPTPRR